MTILLLSIVGMLFLAYGVPVILIKISRSSARIVPPSRVYHVRVIAVIVIWIAFYLGKVGL